MDIFVYMMLLHREGIIRVGFYSNGFKWNMAQTTLWIYEASSLWGLGPSSCPTGARFTDRHPLSRICPTTVSRVSSLIFDESHRRLQGSSQSPTSSRFTLQFTLAAILWEEGGNVVDAFVGSLFASFRETSTGSTRSAGIPFAIFSFVTAVSKVRHIVFWGASNSQPTQSSWAVVQCC